jgi:hypothetical protein
MNAKKMHYANEKQMRVGVAILRLQINKTVKRNKAGHYIMINGLSKRM